VREAGGRAKFRVVFAIRMRPGTRESWRAQIVRGLTRRQNQQEIEQDELVCSRGARLTQILFVLPGELPGVMDIIGKMHDFDFVAFIQRRPKLVFAE
jgi:hypothetical protein